MNTRLLSVDRPGRVNSLAQRELDNVEGLGDGRVHGVVHRGWLWCGCLVLAVEGSGHDCINIGCFWSRRRSRDEAAVAISSNGACITQQKHFGKGMRDAFGCMGSVCLQTGIHESLQRTVSTETRGGRHDQPADSSGSGTARRPAGRQLAPCQDRSFDDATSPKSRPPETVINILTTMVSTRSQGSAPAPPADPNRIIAVVTGANRCVLALAAPPSA